jgi:hypothetical protein
MKKIVRLTENDLTKIVKKVIREQEHPTGLKTGSGKKTEIIDKTVTLYSDVQQQDRMVRATIFKVEDHPQYDGLNLTFTHIVFDSKSTDLLRGMYRCGSGKIALNNPGGSNSNHKLKSVGYNEQLTDVLMKEYCTSDFAQTGSEEESDFA